MATGHQRIVRVCAEANGLCRALHVGSAGKSFFAVAVATSRLRKIIGVLRGRHETTTAGFVALSTGTGKR